MEPDQVTLYIGPKGNDSNDGLTSDTALASVKRAIALASSLYRDQATTISVLIGPYTEAAISPLATARQLGLRVILAES